VFYRDNIRSIDPVAFLGFFKKSGGGGNLEEKETKKNV